MSRSIEVLLLLGGNEEDPSSIFRSAEMSLKKIGEIRARSRDHWTEPWGFRDDRLFLNRALLFTTTLVPDALMEACLGIEREHGRIRKAGIPIGPRPLDIDILLIGDLIQRSGILELPHPRMHLRTFALQPAADIAPSWIHPIEGRSILQLLDSLLPTYHD